MANPSSQDNQIPAVVDPTGYNSITGAQLKSMFDAILPYTDKGLVVTTTDNGVPPYENVPIATTGEDGEKWQQYIWRRITATGVLLYVWNPSKTPDSLLCWESILASGLAANSVVTAMIDDLAVTDAKINDVDFDKITNLPAADTDLTGTYPSLTIADDAVNSDKLASSANVDGDRAITANHIKNKVIVPDRHLSLADSSSVDHVARGVIRMNAAKTAFEVVNAGIYQQIVIISAAVDSGAAEFAPGSAPAWANGNLLEALSTAITPTQIGSTIVVEVTLQVSAAAAADVVAGLFIDEGGVAVSAGVAAIGASNYANTLSFTYVMTTASLSQISFDVRYGANTGAGTSYVNSAGNGSTWGGSLTSSIKVTEYKD